jgi:hypothetical protein
MQNLRNALNLARLVLVWFALTLGVAIASPVIKPQALSLVCSGIGAVKLVVSSDDGTVPATSSHTLSCAMCFAPGAPPLHSLPVSSTFERMTLVADALVQSPPTLQTSAPPPARGPPDLI